MVVDEVRKHDQFVLYGAQVIAVGAYYAIRSLTGRNPMCFAVGKPAGTTFFPKGNPDEIEGIPVRAIEEVPTDTFIVVGVTELIQKEVLPYLSEQGYEHIYPLTQHEEHLLMSMYYRSIGRFPAVENETGEKAAAEHIDFAIYEVGNDRDKPLTQHPALFPYEHPIQAGAALASSHIAEITDDTGDNISERNRMYCEMSAVYWVWKNTDHDWVGIEHYRRHLLVKPWMLTSEVDAIMPLPYICYPHEAAQFRRFVSEDVLQALLRALKQLHPDQYEEYKSILYGQYQYTYNLVCARRDVFRAYCGWFFEITQLMETMADEVPEIRETRALSYVAEVLTNLYFMSHQQELKILHVEKAIYT